MENKYTLIGIRNAAKFLNISANTLYAMIKDEKVPCLRVGGNYHFDPEELINHFKIHPIIKTE